MREKENTMKIWKKEDIRNLLIVRDDAVVRGMLVIYDLQTADEQNSEYTIEANGVGYSGAHAEIMTSFSKFYLKNNFLSRKQINIARRIILKYTRQLAEAANKNEEKKWEADNGSVRTPDELIAICDEG